MDRELKRQKSLAERTNMRRKLIEGYGGRCVCCSETEYRFLQLDHVHGGGNRERAHTHHEKLWRQLIRDGFPPTHRLLCSNCNHATGMYGSCPHQS